MEANRSSAPSAKRVRIGERTMLACTHCKAKKLKARSLELRKDRLLTLLKCDGQTPKCRNCVRSDRDCLVEDPATGLHRPRDYLNSLERRVAYLESLLQQTRPDVALDHLDGNANQTNDEISQRHMSGIPRNHHDSPVDGDNVDDLSTEVALLCLNAAGREPHYFGPSCAVSFSRVISATMGLAKRTGSSQHSDIVHDTQNPEVHRTVSVSFPSPGLAATLSQAYFKNIHPQYPFLHKPTFKAWEELCMRANLSGDLESAGDSPLFFVLAVYAIASLAMGPAYRDSADAYYSMALEHQASVLEVDGLESIQSLLCCAVYSIRSPAGASLWKVSGMAIRLCVELGYHRSVAKYRKLADPLSAEMSRRCFWVAYDIDRVAAFTLGRPVGISDDVIDVELPCDLEDEYLTRNGFTQPPRLDPNAPPTYMTGAIHVIKLRKLWSKFANTLYPTTIATSHPHSTTRQVLAGALRQELEEWHASIPEPVESSSTHPLSVFASRTWFQLAYAHSILLLYRHYITVIPPPEEEASVEAAFEQCALRAREICLLYRQLYQRSTIQFTWGSLHIFFMAGLTYLYCLWRSPRVRQAARQADVINTCMACNTVLVVMAERWKEATTYRDTFSTLSEKTINMICNNQPLPDNITSYPTFEEIALAVANDLDQSTVSQDWALSLGELPIPDESDWLIQELLQEMRDFSQPDITYDDLAEFTT